MANVNDPDIQSRLRAAREAHRSIGEARGMDAAVLDASARADAVKTAFGPSPVTVFQQMEDTRRLLDHAFGPGQLTNFSDTLAKIGAAPTFGDVAKSLDLVGTTRVSEIQRMIERAIAPQPDRWKEVFDQVLNRPTLTEHFAQIAAGQDQFKGLQESMIQAFGARGLADARLKWPQTVGALDFSQIAARVDSHSALAKIRESLAAVEVGLQSVEPEPDESPDPPFAWVRRLSPVQQLGILTALIELVNGFLKLAAPDDSASQTFGELADALLPLMVFMAIWIELNRKAPSAPNA